MQRENFKISAVTVFRFESCKVTQKNPSYSNKSYISLSTSLHCVLTISRHPAGVITQQMCHSKWRLKCQLYSPKWMSAAVPPFFNFMIYKLKNVMFGHKTNCAIFSCLLLLKWKESVLTLWEWSILPPSSFDSTTTLQVEIKSEGSNEDMLGSP